MLTERFFSPVRFCKVCKKDLLESWKTNLWRFVILYAVLAAMIVMFYFKGTALHAGATSLLIFVVMGCVYASSVMEKMTTRQKRIAYLMLPATSFEKYLSRMLYSLVLYTVAFAVAFELADLTGAICGAVFSPFHSPDTATEGLFEFLAGRSRETSGSWTILSWFCLYLFFHSCFILGGNIWYKHPFPKTIAALLVLFIIYTKVASWSAEFFLDGPRLGLELREGESGFQGFVSGLSLVFIGFALFNWTLAYYRFKEAEVINRII